MVDPEANAGLRANGPPERVLVERGETGGEGFLKFEVFVAEDIPGVFVARSRIEKAIVTDADAFVAFAVVDRDDLKAVVARVEADASSVHGEVAYDGDQNDIHGWRPFRIDSRLPPGRR